MSSSPAPVDSYAQRLRTPAGQRALGIGLALVAELLLLLLLFSLGTSRGAEEKSDITIVSLKARDFAEDTPASEPPQPQPRPQEQPDPAQARDDTPPPPSPVEPAPQPIAEPAATPPPRIVLPAPREQPSADVYPRPIQPPQPGRPVAGPPGRSGGAARDTARVGTAPNGEPLYAAAWYREPAEDELRGYLSTASGPGWGLIACRTAPDYRVEDCVGLAEYPQGSQINRAVLAAAWQFKVRPPRLGGRPQIGSWVRIRIDYEVRR